MSVPEERIPWAGGYDIEHDRYEAEVLFQKANILLLYLSWTSRDPELREAHMRVIRETKIFLRDQIGRYGSIEEVDKSMKANFPGALLLSDLRLDWSFLKEDDESSPDS